MTLVEAYRALGIDPTAVRADAVTRRYRELVKTMHPDVKPPQERERATAALQVIIAAYGIVRDSGFPSVTPPKATPTPPPYAGVRPPPTGGVRPPPGAAHTVWPGSGRGPTPQPGVRPGVRPGAPGTGPGGFGPGFPPGGFGPGGFPPGGFAPGGFAPGGFAQGGFAAAAARSREDNALLGRVASIEAFISGASRWYGVTLAFVVIRASYHPVTTTIVGAILGSLVAWFVASRTRRQCVALGSVLAGNAPAHLRIPIRAELGQAAARVTSAVAAAFAILFFALAMR